MTKIFILFALACLLSSSFAGITVTATPDPANSTSLINVTINDTDAGSFSYNYSYRNWTGTLANYTNNSAFLCDWRCSPRIFIDVIRNDSLTATGSVLVFSVGQQQVAADLFTSQIMTFYTTYQNFILGFLVLGISWGLTNSLSAAAISSSVLYFITFILLGATASVGIFLYAGIILFGLGVLLKYVGY